MACQKLTSLIDSIEKNKDLICKMINKKNKQIIEMDQSIADITQQLITTTGINYESTLKSRANVASNLSLYYEELQNIYSNLLKYKELLIIHEQELASHSKLLRIV